MQQIDLEDWLTEQQAAEHVAHSDIPAGNASSEISTPAFSGEEAKAEDIKFFREVAHIRNEETSQPAHDYRFLLRPIQQMLAPEEGRGPSVCACGHARGENVGVHLIDRENGSPRASATGIYRCGNGEACPVCARHVAALRAKRYRLVHEAVNARGGTMLTFVFTIEHDPEDGLAPLLAALKSASTGVRSDRRWNEKIAPMLHAVGAITDVHVRWSAGGGWHPHLHVTLPCLTSDREALKAGAAMLIERFVERLARLGYRASRQLQSMAILDTRPNAYPAHHHRRAQVEGELADEMDENTSLSPFDIAELAAAGNSEMKARFVEFFEAMRGTKSGVITAKMAKTLGIEAGTDPAPGFDETTRVGSIPSPVWMKLLDLNLSGTFLGHVETFGRAGWQRSRWWALQQTGFAPPIDTAIADEMMVAIKAIELLSDPNAKTIGKNLLGTRIKSWTDQHGRELVAATLSYAEAHAPFAVNGDAEAEDLAAVLETWTGKAACRRRNEASHMTLPVCDSPPAAANVPHGSVSDHVGQNPPISQHV